MPIIFHIEMFSQDYESSCVCAIQWAVRIFLHINRTGIDFLQSAENCALSSVILERMFYCRYCIYEIFLLCYSYMALLGCGYVGVFSSYLLGRMLLYICYI